MKDTLIFTATYNEIKNIEKIIKQINIYSKKSNILIIDDNSPDGTAKKIKKLKKKNKNIFLKIRKYKQGLDSAHKYAYEFAKKNRYRKLITMDADLSHDPNEIIPMFNLLNENDLVVGSRYKGGLRVINWPIQRLYISYFANLYAKVITGVPVKDLTAGFKAWIY